MSNFFRFWLHHCFNKNSFELLTNKRTKVFFIRDEVSYYDEARIDKALRNKSETTRFLIPIKTLAHKLTFFGKEYVHLFISHPFAELYGGPLNVVALIELANMLEQLNRTVPIDLNQLIQEAIGDNKLPDRELVIFDSVIVNLPTDMLNQAVLGMTTALSSGVLSKEAHVELEDLANSIINSIERVNEARNNPEQVLEIKA